MTFSTERCCGKSRTAGDLYIEIATSPFGRPQEDFYWCPPQPINIEELGGSKIGMHLMPPRSITTPTEQRVVYDVIDWIGEDSYPNLLDFFTEAKAIGFSRKVSSTFDFSKLSAESYLFFVHTRGYIENFKEYVASEPDAPRIVTCPLGKHKAKDDSEMCARLWWCDITDGPGEFAEITHNDAIGLHSPEWSRVVYEGAKPETLPLPPHFDRLRRVMLPCGQHYDGFLRPQLTPRYHPAIVGAFPIGRIVAIRAADGRHEAKAERARKSSLPVEIEEA